ncbi:MAG TPA: PKD domain-containing protein, partial [Bacteroidia bacterium]|nr:PKD domain-containing protein [Bacteroidia bacterium]
MHLKKLQFLIILVAIQFSYRCEAQFILNGNASTTSSECSAAVTTYELTPQQKNQGGQIWYTTQVSLTKQFDIQFQMFLGKQCYNCGGADGICFVFQQQSTNAGSLGGGLGYAGITPSVAVEFDTYQNGWDPPYCHTAIEKNGDVNHTDGSGNNLAGPVQLDPANPLIPDGNWHNMEITWNPTTQVLSVYYDCSLRLTYTGDLINGVFGGNPNVYWGFTAGTGGGDNTQEVCLTHSYLNNLRDTVVCKGSPVTMTSSGGTTYTWSPATGLNTATGASVIATPNTTTTYTVSIANSCGLIIKDSAVIRVSNTALTTSSTPTTCGNTDGTASVTPAGGINPYTYTWTGGQTTTTATGLTAASYTVTSLDSIGCKATATVLVGGSPPIRDSIVSFTNVSVACGNNGTATVGVKGGSGTYTYSWNTAPVQTNAMATNLPAGSYTVTVNDAAGGCSGTATVTIAQPGALTASISGTTPTSCFAGADGTATAGVTGGSAPYTYSWNSTPAQTTSTATALAAGSYTVSVTDANNCTVQATAVITQPPALRDSIANTVAVLCNGQSNGTATDGVKGGTGTYTYSWNTAPVQTNSTATALAMGSYTVTVTDANGCKDSTVATVTQPTPVTLTAAAFAAACNGACNGSATVIPKGGTGTFTYAWSTTPVQTGATANGLCAGNYSVVVTDANGCVHDTNPLTVTQPPALALTDSVTSAFCNKADGYAAVTITGGTTPYVYQWSTGPVTTSISNVKPGTYTFGVVDANKCTATISVTVPNIPGETASITSTTTVTCNGGNNGTAAGMATGGVLPYTYSWNDPAAQTSDSATGLSAGTYTLTVTDSAGCVSTAVATVTQPALVVATPLATPATICDGDSSTLSATAIGGTAPYTFTWNTGTTASSINVGPATTTTYTVTTADINNCPGQPVPVVVTVNPPLAVTTGTPAAMCPGSSATVHASASGGNGGPYTYTWTPGNVNGSSISVSPATSQFYTVTVTDGCTKVPAVDSMLVIVDPLPAVAFTTDTDNGCYPACIQFTNASTIALGSIKSWNWSFGDGQSAAIKDTDYCYKTPGQYTVVFTVTSDSGCVSALTQTNLITVYDHPHTEFTDAPQPTTILSPDITFTDQTTDLYGLTQWLWSFGDTASPANFSITQNTSHTYADTGTYTVTLRDVNAHGCIDSVTHYIVIDALFTLYIPSAFTPNADGLNDVFAPKGTYFSSFDMYIFDRWGLPIYHSTDIDKGWNGSVNNTGKACLEDTYVYLINVTDFKGLSHSYLG